MYDKDSKGISWTAGFFMLIAFAVAANVLAFIISKPIWFAMTGIDFSKMLEASADPANRDAARVVQCISAVVGLLLPALVTAFVLNRKPARLLGFSQRINGKQAGLVCAIMLSAMFALGFFSYVNNHIPISESLKQQFDKMETENIRQTEAILGLNNIQDYLISLFIIGFLPALCEEALFRGGLQNFLTRSTMKPWLSIIVVSILFSALHFSFYGFLPRLFLGVMLGALYHYSGSIWLSIIAHFFNNALVVTVVYIQKQQGTSIPEAMGQGNSSWLGVFALPVVIALLMVFKKITVKPKEVSDGAGKNEELRNTPFY